MAADKRRTRGSRAANRRRLAIVGLVAFAAVDVLLVAAAVAQRGPSADEAAGERSPVVSESSASAETPSATPTPTATPAPTGVVASRLLSVVDGDTAWRTAAGTCPAPGGSVTVERSTDGGATWAPSVVTTDAELRSVDRLQTTDASTAFLVGAGGASCAQVFTQTFSAGQSFRDYPDRLGAAWYVAAADRATVHSPAGTFAAPCPAVTSLAVSDDLRAAALCSDGTVSTTSDAAASWSTPVSAPGTVSLSAGTGGYLLAQLGQAGCEGVSVASLPAGSTAPATLACATETAPVAAEELALGADGSAVWLWSSDEVLVSTDGGTTW